MSDTQQIEATVRALARSAGHAARALAAVSTDQKNAVLRRVAKALRSSAKPSVLEANAQDLRAGEAAGLSAALLDRLRLDEARIDAIAEGVDAVIALPDPVGAILNERELNNGLKVAQMRVPIGVIGIIYESRPNVTVDAAALCLKSGNAVLLRGGKEAFASNAAFAQIFNDALKQENLPEHCVTLLPTTDRHATMVMIGLDEYVDMVIPRGGEGLIRFVSDNARVPVIRHYKGVCHVYVDGAADLKMAREIALNAKTQRPGVCNAMETLLVDEACAEEFLPACAKALQDAGVELIADARASQLLPQAKPAEESAWDTEYLDLILNIGIVDGIGGALEHVARHGSNHTEAIVTEDKVRAERWVREVDASLVLVNASTRFNDGYQLGLGAEIGISTTKMHAYGPMGLQELCTLKWVGRGQGQIRT